MDIKLILSVIIIAYGLIYGILIIAKAAKAPDLKSHPGNAGIISLWEFIVYFLSTMGMPDYLMNTLFIKHLDLTDDKDLPPTLVASAILPGAIIAFAYLISGAYVEGKTLIICVAAISLGSFSGAKVMSSLDGQLIRRIMIIALSLSVVALIFKIIISSAASGSETGLSGRDFFIVVPVIFFLGFINMFGIPMKPPSTALFLLLGLSPLATLTLVLTMGCVSPMAGSIQVYRAGNFHLKMALCSTILGSIGATCGVFFATSLDPDVLNIILIIIMLASVVTMARKK